MNKQARYFHTIEEAVKTAKSRAKSSHTTQYIYRTAIRKPPNYHVSGKLVGKLALVRITSDGTIERVTTPHG